MSCCNCAEQTTPKRGELTNLEYLELCTEVKEAQEHAKNHHAKEVWMCKLWHSWHAIIDANDDTHRVCHRCGRYRSWEREYRSPTYIHGY